MATVATRKQLLPRASLVVVLSCGGAIVSGHEEGAEGGTAPDAGASNDATAEGTPDTAGGQPDGSTPTQVDGGCGPGLVVCGGVCVAPTSATCSSNVTVIASGQDSPSGIALDANNVYWPNNANAGAVMWMPKSGGTPAAFAADQANPVAVAVDATSVYWGSPMALDREARSGGAISYLDPSGAVSIALDAVNVYWITNFTNGVSQAAKSGGPPIVLAENLTAPVSNVAVDGTAVFWTIAAPGGTVSSIPKGGGQIKLLASSQNLPTGVAVDAKNVYWTNNGDGSVCSVPIAGGAVHTLTTGPVGAGPLTLDGATLYWASYLTGDVMKMSVAGGTPTMIATGQNQPVMVAVDAVSAFWTNAGGGQIMRAPK
jgi:hypothetical protein